MGCKLFSQQYEYEKLYIAKSTNLHSSIRALTNSMVDADYYIDDDLMHLTPLLEGTNKYIMCQVKRNNGCGNTIIVGFDSANSEPIVFCAKLSVEDGTMELNELVANYTCYCDKYGFKIYISSAVEIEFHARYEGCLQYDGIHYYILSKDLKKLS